MKLMKRNPYWQPYSCVTGVRGTSGSMHLLQQKLYRKIPRYRATKKTAASPRGTLCFGSSLMSGVLVHAFDSARAHAAPPPSEELPVQRAWERGSQRVLYWRRHLRALALTASSAAALPPRRGGTRAGTGAYPQPCSRSRSLRDTTLPP
eukprot:COSAG03_NODE_1485_length_4000_cov_27.150218_5_plen_149_part_00